MSKEGVFSLPDGRRMAFAEYGAGQGRPVLFCHGTPGSRLGITPGMADIAEGSGVRLIVPDRPGFGRSDPQPGRTLAGWADDAGRLMDGLGIREFGVVGYSSGGLYALACGWALSGRVTAVALASPLAPNLLAPEVATDMTPVVRESLRQARDEPEGLSQGLAPLIEAPEQFFDLLAGSVAPIDREVLTHPGVSEGLQRDCRESLVQGVAALVEDFVLAVRDWNIALEAVSTPATIWQGLADINTPPAMAEYLAERLPRCRLQALAGEGHFCLHTHWAGILAELATPTA